MEKLLDIEVVTPKEKVYKGKAFSVTVPGTKSPFQILYNHAPIVSSLDNGKVIIVDDKNNEIIYRTGTGFTELQNNKVSILVEEADKVLETENI